MSNELWRKGALELAGMIARKEVSSRDVVAAHLARIDEVNPWLNAVVRRWDDASLAAADAADKAVAAGDSLGALHGVPVTVKENIDLAGTPTTQAVAFLAEAVSTSDAPLVQRLRCGCHSDRSHQPARSGAAHHHRVVAARRHAQPVAPRSYSGRFQRW